MKINKKEAAGIGATVVFMVLMGIITVLLGNSLADGKGKGKMTAGVMTPSRQTKEEINVWYYDESFVTYLEKAAQEYEKSNGIRVNCIKVPEENYLEKINEYNISGNDVPGIYIMNSTMLEKAVLAGLSMENKSDSIYNDENYSKTAIQAITYKGRKQAYPLNFDTSVMIYNQAYTQAAPATFDDIIAFSNCMDDTMSGMVENVLAWDIRDLMYNYGFAGAYLEYGGKNGDDPTAKSFTGENLIQTMNYYHNLNQIFSIDINNSSYDDIITRFSQGKIVYTIAGTDIIKKLDEQQTHVSYGLCMMPDMNGELKTKTLAVTNVAVVNPYAADTRLADDFADYISYKMAEEMYELTGKPSGRKDIAYDDNQINVMVDQYEKSVNLPKLMEAGDFGAKLESVLNGIWTGGDIAALLGTL